MTEAQCALVVDDERDIRELLVMALIRQGLRVETAANLADARAQLARQTFDLCLTDMRLPDGSGMDLIADIAKHHPDTPVAMITAFGNVEAAVNALKAGAFDFVNKPVDLKVLRGLVQRALELRTTRIESARPLSRLTGDSEAMQTLRATVAKVARSQAPVHIHGESGTGKELVARTIHGEGGRAAGPFVPVNCGAIPSELMESELFGHKKGSFTGAHSDKIGLFQAAEGGTLFLDEIAELPLQMQVKLLRAIQEKSVRPVGANSEIQVDVRLLSATHKDLAQLVADGRFRHDLYYRINVIELRVPPLRERGQDLQLIAKDVLHKLCGQQGRPVATLSPGALAAMAAYPFPGNIRELENTLERALALADSDVLSAEDLHLPVSHATPTVAPPMPSAAPDWAFQSDAPAPSVAMPTPPAPGSGAPLDDYIEDMERAAIQKALLENRYNKTRTAEALGITFRSLRYKLKKLGIE